MNDFLRNYVQTTLGELCVLDNGVKVHGEKLPLLDVKYLRGKKEAEYLDSGVVLNDGQYAILVDGENSGEVFRIHETGYMGSTFKRLACPDDRLLEYLLYIIKFNQKMFRENKKGSAIPHLDKKLFKELSINLPPLAEQGRIVAKIEELFAGIDAGVENLKSVKNQIALYRQSVLKSAFDGTLYKTTEWNFTSIGTVCDINPKTVLPDFSDDSIVSFLPMPTVEAETGAFSPEMVEYKKVKKGYTKFQNNDVLFAKITPCMENGKSCVVRDLIQGVGFGSTEFHVLRCHAGMLPEYVFYFVVQKVFRSKAIPFMTGAVGQKRIPADYLRDCEIPIPSLTEQERIVAEIESRFERADVLETTVDAALADAEKLKQAVLKKAFSGELVPQNPDDEPASVLLDRIRAERAAEQRANPKKGKRKR